MKGFLTSREVDFEWVHDIKYLLGLCTPIDVEFERFSHLAESLNDYAVRFRYPSSRPDPTAQQALEALAAAREVLDFVHARLPAETNPQT